MQEAFYQQPGESVHWVKYNKGNDTVFLGNQEIDHVRSWICNPLRQDFILSSEPRPGFIRMMLIVNGAVAEQLDLAPAPAELGEYLEQAIITVGLDQQALSEMEAISAEAFDSDSRFVARFHERKQLTGGVNPVIAGEILADLGLELSVLCTPEGFELKLYQGNSFFPNDDLKNRDGDYIDGQFYGQRKAEDPKKLDIKSFDPKMLLRINRHYKKRERRQYEEKRQHYEELLLSQS